MRRHYQSSPAIGFKGYGFGERPLKHHRPMQPTHKGQVPVIVVYGSTGGYIKRLQ